jgi:hypothetical protein
VLSDACANEILILKCKYLSRTYATASLLGTKRRASAVEMDGQELWSIHRLVALCNARELLNKYRQAPWYFPSTTSLQRIEVQQNMGDVATLSSYAVCHSVFQTSALLKKPV